MTEQVPLAEYGVEPQYESILNNEAALQDLFVRREKSSYEIARITDSTSGVVQSRLRKFGIYRDEQVRLDEQELRQLYVEEGATKEEIADEFDTSAAIVDRHIRYFGLADEISDSERRIKRRARDGKVVQFRTWGGAGVGAYEIWEPNPTDCRPASQVLHHRLLAVAEYGFDAVVNKQVHHKNGIPWDNRPENIEPISQRDHIGKHWHPNEVYRSIADAERHELIQALKTAGYTSAANAIKRQTASSETAQIKGGASA